MARKSSRKNKIILILLVLLLTAGVVTFQKTKKQTQFEPYFIGSSNRIEPKIASDNLNTQISDELSKFEGSWGVAIRDLKIGKTYLYNADQEIASASLYKLPVMWAAYQAIKDGQLEEEDVQNQLGAMITYSDNDSAIYLAETLGWQNIEKLMARENLAGFKLSDPNPKTTAKSTLDLFERIYSNTAVSNKASQKMKDLLFAQTVNDRIPKYLPKDVKIGHKTGELDFLRHDAGIVIGKNSHYIFVFLSETPIPEEASENIALLSKKIFDELEKQ